MTFIVGNSQLDFYSVSILAASSKQPVGTSLFSRTSSHIPSFWVYRIGEHSELCFPMEGEKP